MSDLRGAAPGPRFRASVAALDGAQKTRRGVSIYSIHVNRPLGRRLAAAAHVLGRTPNQVTGISALCSATAIGLLALAERTVLLGVVVAALLVSGFAFDAADGQLARLQATGSPAGEWLDHVVDCATKVALHSAVLVGSYRDGDRGTWLLVPLGFQLAAVLLFFGGAMAGVLLAPTRQSGVPGHASRQSPRGSSVLLLLADYGTICCCFLLWGLPDAFRVVYAVLFVAHVGYLTAFSLLWFRELAAGAHR